MCPTLAWIFWNEFPCRFVSAIKTFGDFSHKDALTILILLLFFHFFPQVLPYVDSIGLNEQEIIFASEAGGGPHSDNLYDDNGQPFIHKISDIILWIMKTFGQSTKDKSKGNDHWVKLIDIANDGTEYAPTAGESKA